MWITNVCADDGSNALPAPAATFSIAPKKHVDFDVASRCSTDAGCRSEHVRDVDLVVGWEGPDDPDNPRNWTRRRRWILTLVVSLFTFIRFVELSIAR